MNNAVNVSRVQAIIRRDACTTTAVEFLEHEMPIIRLIHGKDNVVVASRFWVAVC